MSLFSADCFDFGDYCLVVPSCECPVAGAALSLLLAHQNCLDHMALQVYQWDMDTGDLVQEYDYHLAAVNTITFVDEGRRFVSTSDDKTIRVWEFGIPVQIKYIADPGMHSIPAVTLHPSNQYFIGQSLDNQIVTYSAKDKFRQNRKKVFKVNLSLEIYSCGVPLSTAMVWSIFLRSYCYVLD